MATNFSAMDTDANKYGNKEITLKAPETCKALREVLDGFDKWADERILDCRTMPAFNFRDYPSYQRLLANIDTLESSKANLARIIKEISTKES